MDPEALNKFITGFLDDRKAFDVISIDLRGKSSIADYMIIASGTSQRHVGSMVSLLEKELKTIGIKSVNIEGNVICDWVLLDAGDVIVHVFRPEIRDFYQLEKMWGIEPPKRKDSEHSAAVAF